MFYKSKLERVLRRRFAVTLENGTVFSGILIDQDREQYIFASVRVRQENGWQEAAGGNVYIDREKVAYLQRTDAV